MERAFGTISSIVRDLGENKAVQDALIFAVWKETVGEQISARAIPFDYVDRRLMIAVEDQTWKHQLEALAPTMLGKLNRQLKDRVVAYLEFHEDPSRFVKPDDQKVR